MAPGPTGEHDAGTTGTSANQQAAQPSLGALDGLDEVPGIGPKAAQVTIAELGLDMGQLPTRRTGCRGPDCRRRGG
jgi:transposase